MKTVGLIAALLGCISGAHAQVKKVPRQEVNFYVSRNVAPGPKIQLQINTRNLAAIKVKLSKIDALAWLRLNPGNQRVKPVPAKVGREFIVNMLAKGQRMQPAPQDNYLSKQINLPLLNPGLYLLESPSASAGDRWVVINVTNLAVSTKRSPKRLLTWVTDFHTGTPVKDAAVMLASNGDIKASGTTDADGINLTEQGPGSQRVIVRRGEDFAEVQSMGINPDGVLKTHIQTDRPIYRPGQTLFFKAIMRLTSGQGYAPIADSEFRVELRDPRDTVLDIQNLKSNALGSVTGKFDLPSEAGLGTYSLVFKRGKLTAYHSLMVQAYRKPEYKVTVTPGVKRALAGETVTFKVKAEYYFGAPVPQAEVRWVARRNDSYFYGGSQDDWAYNGDGNLYPRDTYDNEPFAGEGTVYTDNKGEVNVELKTDPKAPDSSYTFSVTVTDASRRQVEGSASVPVYAAEVRLGLSTNLLAIPLGKLIPVDIRVVNLDGGPAGGTVEMKLLDSRWNEKKEEMEDVLLATQTVKVGANGRASTTLPAKAAGDLRVVAQIKDRTGRVALDTMYVYVAGPFTKTVEEKEEPAVTVKLDKRSYLPGDTVSAFATTNQGGRPILFTAQGEDLWAYKVVRTKGKSDSVTWTVPTGLKHVPNIMIEAEQWSKEGHSIESSQWVYLFDKNRQLKVEVTPDKPEYEPGDKATYKVKTTTLDGKPTSAEVALSVVDEAIYAIMPDNTADLFRTYWGRRDNKVSSYESAPEEVSGGAYQRANAANVPVRQRFEDTAFWNATVMTDASGQATISFDVPGNLTTWRATARAVTDDTRVGMTKGTVMATRPFTLRLASPRQMVVGDQISLIATVNNRTKEDRNMRVDLKVDGQTRTKDLTVKAGLEGQARFEVTAAKLGTIELEGHLFGSDGTPLDALISRVPVVPDGVEDRIVAAGQFTGSTTTTLTLPSDRIADAGTTTVRVWPGIGDLVSTLRVDALKRSRYATQPVAAQIRLAALGNFGLYRKEMLEAVAYLSRSQAGSGWGYWESDPARSWPTAYVVESLVMGRNAEGTVEIPRISPRLIVDGANALDQLYRQTNLWEERAYVAAALKVAGHKNADGYLAEVKERGQNLSPYSKVRMSLATGDAKWIQELLPEISRGTTSFLPVGDGIGWRASEFETNAWLVIGLARMKMDRDLQGSILRHLLTDDSGWHSPTENAALAEAIHAYLGGDLKPVTVDSATVTVNGQTTPLEKSRVDGSLSVALPTLNAGANRIEVKASANGEVFYQVESRIFRPLRDETQFGVRIFRRFEVRTANGVWKELDRDILPNEPVRVTSLVWSDSLEDPMRIIEPIPAGFEFLEDDWTFASTRSEVRDGSVTHYFNATGMPFSFRYYLRAETDGKLIVSPAIAEVLRRPSRRGQSRREEVKVVPAIPPR